MKSTVLRLPAMLAIPAHPAAATHRFLIGAVILLLPLVVLGQTGAGAMNFVTYTQAHAVLEGLTVALSVMIFMLAWSTRGAGIEARFGAAGMIFAGIAMLNMAHFLTFPGMPGVDEHSGLQRSLSFWMPTQAMTAAALLAAALLPSSVEDARNLIRLSGSLTLAASGLMLGLEFLRPGWLPVWWVTGSGLTPAKVLGEYLIAIAFAGATLLLVFRAWRDASAEERTASTLLAWAALILSIGELAFTLYSGVSDWVALLGHLYRITAFLLVYQALFVHGVQLPYQRMADSERTLAESRARYRQLFETSPDGILLLDADDTIRGANPSITRMFGHAGGELLGRPLDSLIAWDGQDGSPRLHAGHVPLRSLHALTVDKGTELTGKRRDASRFPMEVELVPLEHSDADDLASMCIMRDVTERKRLENQLVHQAMHDALTNLPNRVLLLDRMEQARLQAQRSDSKFAVMFLDLDDFKKINDSLGHQQGDLLLRQVSERLSGVLREDDTLARLGGDEFVILRAGLESGADASRTAEDLIDALRQPFRLGDQDVYIGASIGITFYPDDAQAGETLLRNADLALYQAKAAGRNTFHFFSREMDRQAQERLTLETQLRRAIAITQAASPQAVATDLHTGLELHYQPQVRADGQLVGAEALLRWRNEGQLVMPNRFIPLAEENGLIVPMGAWVLREACRQARQWLDEGLTLSSMAINVSARQFRQHGFVEQVRQVLEETGWPAARLELEITESMIMEAPQEAANALRELAALGVAIAVDDFGTGYSSLAYLKTFRVDRLKIDQAFTRALPDDPDNTAIVNAIMSMAHALGLRVVAEGVETEAQRAWLSLRDCDVMQGWLFGKALPAADFESRFLIRDKRPQAHPAV